MRRPARLRPASLTAWLAALATLAGLGFAACADNVRAGLGQLRLDRGEGTLVTPVLLPPSAPFVYPPDAWARGVGGEALLRIRISSAGRVDSVEIVNSAGDAVLDSAALASARRLRFRPALQGDAAVAVWGRLPVHFPAPAAAGGGGPPGGADPAPEADPVEGADPNG
ncbi:energy transducer TonB [Candidatus Palauibacter sp.]|uniref:energy transducer TonB n=1 Tax=Candidatus Palauibacter sp. TaxID=3101350 RepID=UPI003B01F03C